MTNALKTAGEQTLPTMTKSELDKLEGRIREGLKTFRQVGEDLMQIRERHGYALRGYPDFPTYCEKEFGFGKRQGERLMLAAETAQKVEKLIGEAPRNESSARVLTGVAKDPKLLTKLKERLDKQKLSVATATAEKLQEVVDKITPHTKAMFDDGPTPAEKAAAPILKSLTDACPSCKRVPGSYVHGDQGWHCGDCNAGVRVSAVPIEIVLCRECKAPLLGDAGYCVKCGSVQ